jgi:class 3 adenylate cyclase
VVGQTRYAKSGDLSIAYRVVGKGQRDLILVPGYVTHLDMIFESPPFANFVERLTSFARVMVFDKRGTGLSDPVESVATLEERMDDLRAVMDAVGSERAALFGVSEGAPMSILFSAAFPERTTALVLYGAMARSTWAEDYPFAAPAEALLEATDKLIAPEFGTGSLIEIFAPSLDSPEAREWLGRYERYGASPRMAAKVHEMFLQIDVRDVLPTVTAPTLVLHRRGDRVVNRRAGEWLARQIQGAKYVELPGVDHLPWAGNSESVLGEVEEFLTGVRRGPEPDRVLLTVLFIDIVDSTRVASEVGDSRWREILDSFYSLARKELERHRGTEVKTTGDGFFASFDGPARAIRCASAISEAVKSLGLEVRAGIHTGEVERRGRDLGGIAVHIGSRVAALAGASEILVSSTVKDLVVGSGIEFADRGEQTLKGVPGDWRLFKALGT